MDRCINSKKGFTLLEMIMALALGAVVLLSSADLLINFAKFTSNMIKAESSLMDTALGSFEEIVYNISRANKTALGSEAAISDPATPFPGTCALNSTCIQVRVDTDAAIKTPGTYSDDIVFTYWIAAGLLYRRIGVGADVVIGRNATILSFSRTGTEQNSIFIILEGQAQSGVTIGTVKERLETTVISQARSI